MRRSLLAFFTLFGVACVDVPQSIHAEFAGPSPGDRTNYRQGTHGNAAAVEEPRAVATTSATLATDAGAPAPSAPAAPYNPLATAKSDASDAGAPAAPAADGGSK